MSGLFRKPAEEFEVNVANLIRDLLVQYNDRNPKKIQDKLDKIRKIIEKDIADFKQILNSFKLVKG